jgi:molybdopterin-binding protein
LQAVKYLYNRYKLKHKGGYKMKLSARNVVKGTVKAIEIGLVNAEVIVGVAPDLEMTSIITKTSCEHLGLEVGKEIYVVVKATNVMIATD